MPVILEPQDFALWLDPNLKGGPALHGLLRPIDSTRLVMHPVDRRVGKPTQDDPSLIRPLHSDLTPSFATDA